MDIDIEDATRLGAARPGVARQGLVWRGFISRLCKKWTPTIGVIRLNPAAKLFTDDTYADARRRCIEEMGERWILFETRGGQERIEQSEGEAKGRRD